MTTITPMIHVFSESEYATRCEHAKIQYQGSFEQDHMPGAVGAICSFHGDNLTSGFETYHQKRKAGYTPLDSASALQTAAVHGTYVQLWLIKPEKMQAADLAVIYAKVRADYETELEAALEAEVERQIQFAIQAAETKKLQEEARQREVIAEQTRKDLMQSREALKAKLIEQGRLTSEGVAG